LRAEPFVFFSVASVFFAPASASFCFDTSPLAAEACSSIAAFPFRWVAHVSNSAAPSLSSFAFVLSFFASFCSALAFAKEVSASFSLSAFMSVCTSMWCKASSRKGFL